MNKDLISIIVPIYNVEKYISKCLNSLINQTYQKIEIICINDGSTDKSRNILEKFAYKDERIKIVSKKNEGVSVARNIGINNATGKYIFFVDSDDYLELNMIEEMINSIKKEKVDLAICGCNKNYFKQGQIYKQVKIQYESLILNNKKEVYKYFTPFFDINGFNTLWNKIYVTEIIKKNYINFKSNIHMGEDFIFNIQYIQHISSCVCLNKCLYNYRIEHNVLSKRYDSNTYENRNYSFEQLTIFLNKNNLSLQPIWIQYIKNIYASIFMLYHKECKLNLKEKLNIIDNYLTHKKLKEALLKIKPEGLEQKVLVAILKSNNKYIIYFTAKIIFKFKENSFLKWILKNINKS